MRPIDADAVVDVICDLHIGGKDGVANALPNTYGADIREIIEQIDSLPSLDAVEVVRCKECRYWKMSKKYSTKGECSMWYDTERSYKDYCSEGRKKDGVD